MTYLGLPRVEPEFISRKLWLERPPVEEGVVFADYLAHRVSRNANDLISHVQRVILVRQQRDQDASYGALLDLFIALGDKGLRLRRRLLATCGTLLSNEQRQALKKGLAKGVLSSDPLPPSRFSRLSNTVDGEVLVERRADLDTGDQYGALEEARDLIDSGQIDTARQLLEAAFAAAPNDGALEEELLNLYRHTKNHEDFAAMRMRQDDASLGGAWDELADHFARQSGLVR